MYIQKNPLRGLEGRKTIDFILLYRERGGSARRAEFFWDQKVSSGRKVKKTLEGDGSDHKGGPLRALLWDLSPNGHGLFTLTYADCKGKMSAAGENFEVLTLTYTVLSHLSQISVKSNILVFGWWKTLSLNSNLTLKCLFK